MTNETLSLSDVVARFNAASPRRRNKRTVQRWLGRHGILGAGSSRHNWFYPAAEVDNALIRDFPFHWPPPVKITRKSRRAA